MWLFYSARCGSTAWSQIFNALPNWTVISESFTHVYNMICTETDFDLKELSETSRYEEMVVSLIKMHLKLAPKGNNSLFKGTATDVHMIPTIRKRFPKHKILFGYRDVLPSARSYFQAFAADMEFLVYYFIDPWLKKVRYEDVQSCHGYCSQMDMTKTILWRPFAWQCRIQVSWNGMCYPGLV